MPTRTASSPPRNTRPTRPRPPVKPTTPASSKTRGTLRVCVQGGLRAALFLWLFAQLRVVATFADGPYAGFGSSDVPAGGCSPARQDAAARLPRPGAEIGRATARTPDTNAHLVCRLLRRI